MLVVGAGGHAKEILEILRAKGQLDGLCFYDDFNPYNCSLYSFPIVKSLEALASIFPTDDRFILGIGDPNLRSFFYKQLTDRNGRVQSVISDRAQIGSYNVVLGNGLNIMDHVFISNAVSIGEGCLLNMGCSVHHDVKIGNFCEISPKAQILGGVQIDEYSRIGAGAIVLPNVRIGKRVIVGAGAVVTKNIDNDSVVVGVPARKIRSSR